MTLHEIGYLTERWRLREARDDRRAALTGVILANVHRDTEQRAEPFSFAEVLGWLGHPFHERDTGEEAAQEAPATPEALLERVKLLNSVYGGAVNGQRES